MDDLTRRRRLAYASGVHVFGLGYPATEWWWSDVDPGTGNGLSRVGPFGTEEEALSDVEAGQADER